MTAREEADFGPVEKAASSRRTDGPRPPRSDSAIFLRHGERIVLFLVILPYIEQMATAASEGVMNGEHGLEGGGHLPGNLSQHSGMQEV